jgi:hypothetical protein
VVANGRADEIAQQFGRDDLEGVFLHLAAVRDAGQVVPTEALS